MEFVVLQINVVNNFGYFAQSRVVSQTELIEQRLESAVFADVSKLRLKHIEMNRAVNLKTDSFYNNCYVNINHFYQGIIISV